MVPTPQLSYDTPPMVGIELLPGGSRAFNDVLRLTVDAGSLASIQSIVPYSVMVRNSTSERLIAVTVRFYLTDVSGRTVWHQMTVGTRSKKPSQMIEPGAVAILTPETGLNTVLRAGTQMHVPEMQMLLSRLSKHAGLYSRQASVTTTIDSVIFEDGGIIGPDKGRMLEMLNSWAAAEDAITEQVFRRGSANLESYLVSLRDAPVPPSASLDDKDHFSQRQHDFAEELLGQKKHFKSEEEFLQYLRSKNLSRIPILKRRDK